MAKIISDLCLSHSVPNVDDLEVSLFGPGFGECLALHLPGGKWILVDSCRNPYGQPASLAYLQEMGVQAGSDVVMVVASHWHLDHVDGISDVVQTCNSAEPVISAALHTRELLAYAGAVQYLGAAAPRPIVELRRLADVVKDAKPSRYITTTQARMRLLEWSYGSIVTSIDSLSPSPASIAAAIAHLSRSNLEAGRELRVPRPDHNGAAVVLRVRSGDVGVLLASDLEINGNPMRGWEAIARLDVRGENRNDMLKIAHHGSVNGDASVIWSQLLNEEPIGMLTHFHNGSVHLPEAEQLELIAGKCGRLFSTSGPAWKPPEMTAERVAELLAEGESLLKLPVGFGHVRARISPGMESEWRISVCGSAAVVPPPALSLEARVAAQRSA